VDDRTPAERSEIEASDAQPDRRLAGGGIRPLSKSRYDSVSCYLETESPVLNDVPC